MVEVFENCMVQGGGVVLDNCVVHRVVRFWKCLWWEGVDEVLEKCLLQGVGEVLVIFVVGRGEEVLENVVVATSLKINSLSKALMI